MKVDFVDLLVVIEEREGRGGVGTFESAEGVNRQAACSSLFEFPRLFHLSLEPLLDLLVLQFNPINPHFSN